MSYEKGVPEPLGVCLKHEKNTVLGTVGCFWTDKKAKGMELAYAISEEYWGKGFAVESANAMIRYCFNELGVERLQARCKKENKASSRVMQKLGMKYEGTLRSAVFHRGRFWDMEYYAILRSEFSR